MSKIIAITGGIGSGKSVISHILRCNSYTVYDCDREAKRLMDNNTDIHAELNCHIHPHAVKNGVIDRRLIAEIVFASPDKLERLNSIVHGAVLDDIRRIPVDTLPHSILFVETAILYQSNLDLVVDSVWNVTAPVDTRIDRVIKRNSCTREDVLSRINSQESYKPVRQHSSIKTIVNDGTTPVLPQVAQLLENEKL
ncbi:MAG: dephospho-CoA kinase [Muribaculaceae bacterium]|nr:dephospho-CoA kinase [Muribaculaceae bacterium]